MPRTPRREPPRPATAGDPLAALRDRLAREREQAQRAEAERQQVERERQQEAELFRRAAGPVAPLRGGARVVLAPPPAAPLARQRRADEQRVLGEALSDGFDAATLLDTDDALSFRRPGVGPDVTRRLRRGDWRIQREIDLHGLRRDEAREALAAFLRDARRDGLRCLRVIHGKGLGSPGKTPVLKDRVASWLAQKAEVLAYVQARPADGGAGALIVLLTAG